MTSALLVAIASAVGPVPSQGQHEYDARLGVPYLLGPKATVSGSNEELDIGSRRWVTLRSVRTAIAFGMEGRTLVAGNGKMLVIFSATIKNPAKMPIPVTDSSTFGLRVYDTKFQAGDVKYLGSADTASRRLDRKLQKGEQVDVQSIYEFPAAAPHLRVGIYFDRNNRATTPKFDLTRLIDKPRSVFAKDALTYQAPANARAGESFDLDDLVFKVGAVEVAEGGYRVNVEVTNPMPTSGRWGWQYANVELVSEDGDRTAYYPDFVVAPAFADWRNTIEPGKTVTGAYKFFPSKSGKLKSFVLTMNSTMRSVKVELASGEEARAPSILTAYGDRDFDGPQRPERP